MVAQAAQARYDNSNDPNAELCPACPKATRNKRKLDNASSAVVDWIACEECETYYHWECIHDPPDLKISEVLTWYCPDCISASEDNDHPLKIEYKRKSARPGRSKHDYSNLDQGLESDANRWAKVAAQKDIKPHPFKVYDDGSAVGIDWVWSDKSMKEPILFKTPKNLGMRLPNKATTVSDVADMVGRWTPVEVIDVASQSDLANWTLENWAQYYTDPNRSKVRNVISLEVSQTPLGDLIDPPRIVREMDWVHNIWPEELRKLGDYPKVSKYCLMSVEKCWTDWHVDFAASSVWYHILRGSKTFYFIKPTPSNLREYEKWSGSHERQENTWLGDKVDAVYQVDLTAGNTMIIPTGWIHSVYTPSDSLVFGGNFLHSLNIPVQLELHRIEVATKVPKKFRFPSFVRFLWFVAKHYQDRLQPKFDAANGKRPTLPHDLNDRVLTGLKTLIRFLKEQIRRMDKRSDASPEQRKAAKESFPLTYIPDPVAFLTAFRANVLAALKETEEDQIDEVKEMEKLKSSHRRSESPPVDTPAKRRKVDVDPSKKPALSSHETKETTVIKETRPVPFDDGTFGSEQEVDVVRTVTTRVSITRAKGAGKIIQQTSTVTSVLEKVVWLDDSKPDDLALEEALAELPPAPIKVDSSLPDGLLAFMATA